jgi:hypothetical protein
MPDKIDYPDELTCDQMGRYKTFRIFQDVKKGGNMQGHIIRSTRKWTVMLTWYTPKESVTLTELVNVLSSNDKMLILSKH